LKTTPVIKIKIDISPEDDPVETADTYVAPFQPHPSGRNTVRKNLEVFDFEQTRAPLKSVRARKNPINFNSTKDEMDPFSERFKEHLNKDGMAIN
jgi:hypothetical protein